MDIPTGIETEEDVSGSKQRTTWAITMAVCGVLVFAGVIRLLSWGSNAITEHLQRVGEGRILGRVLSPSPVRTPQGVVRVQLDSLRNNDVPLPNTGLATSYNFMEPGVRDQLGSFADYVEAMTGSVHAVLFTEAEFRFGPMQINGDLAQQFVEVIPSSGQRVMYIFTLRRQEEGPYEDCWMNQNLVRYAQRESGPGP